MRLLLFTLCVVISTQASHAFQKTTDSLQITGRFVWKDNSIQGFPSKVKVISSLDKKAPIFHPVDSLGKFSFALAKGTYLITSQLNYHWMGEELVRIDDSKSFTEKTFPSDQNIEIVLDTIPWPNRTYSAGLLESETIDFNQVDEFMKERMKFFEIPGATLSLIKDGKVVYSKIYGVTNADTKEPITENTLFEAGSITKLVFAFAVMRLYERGEIDLDKPIYQYVEIVITKTFIKSI